MILQARSAGPTMMFAKDNSDYPEVRIPKNNVFDADRPADPVANVLVAKE